MERTQTQLHVRIPEDVANRVRELAEENDRTLNMQVVTMLRERSVSQLEMEKAIRFLAILHDKYSEELPVVATNEK